MAPATPAAVFVPKPAFGGPIRDQDGNFLVYDRAFLLDCAKSVAVEEMPRGLENKFLEFPHIRRSTQDEEYYMDEMGTANHYFGGQGQQFTANNCYYDDNNRGMYNCPGFAAAWDWKATNRHWHQSRNRAN